MLRTGVPQFAQLQVYKERRCRLRHQERLLFPPGVDRGIQYLGRRVARPVGPRHLRHEGEPLGDDAIAFAAPAGQGPQGVQVVETVSLPPILHCGGGRLGLTDQVRMIVRVGRTGLLRTRENRMIDAEPASRLPVQPKGRPVYDERGAARDLDSGRRVILGPHVKQGAMLAERAVGRLNVRRAVHHDRVLPFLEITPVENHAGFVLATTALVFHRHRGNGDEVIPVVDETLDGDVGLLKGALLKSDVGIVLYQHRGHQHLLGGLVRFDHEPQIPEGDFPTCNDEARPRQARLAHSRLVAQANGRGPGLSPRFHLQGSARPVLDGGAGSRHVKVAIHEHRAAEY